MWILFIKNFDALNAPKNENYFKGFFSSFFSVSLFGSFYGLLLPLLDFLKTKFPRLKLLIIVLDLFNFLLTLDLSPKFISVFDPIFYLENFFTL